MHHQFNAHYHYAWAAYWWLEEIDLFREHLGFCVDIAKEIENSVQWGRVVTLLCLYSNHCRRLESDVCQNDYDSLAYRARNELLGLAEQDERPSNSLMSKACIELLNLQIIESVEHASEIFSSLLAIVTEGELLVGFPFNELYEVTTELDNVFGEVEGYELLLDYFTEQTSLRYGEKNGALLSLKRGARRLDSNEPYQAIKLIGKSLLSLIHI